MLAGTPCVFQQVCPQDTTLVKAPRGTTIVMAEQRASYVYHLHEGVVAFFAATADGQEGVDELIVPPYLIGLAGFAGMYSKRRIYHLAEARAITPAVYCKARREAVWEAMSDQLARAQIMDLICGTFLLQGRFSGPPYVGDVGARIITILDALTTSVGVLDTTGSVVVSGISHDDIAAMATVSRPTVSRMIELLQRKGILVASRRCIVVKRPEALVRNPWV